MNPSLTLQKVQLQPDVAIEFVQVSCPCLRLWAGAYESFGTLDKATIPLYNSLPEFLDFRFFGKTILMATNQFGLSKPCFQEYSLIAMDDTSGNHVATVN